MRQRHFGVDDVLRSAPFPQDPLIGEQLAQLLELIDRRRPAGLGAVVEGFGEAVHDVVTTKMADLMMVSRPQQSSRKKTHDGGLLTQIFYSQTQINAGPAAPAVGTHRGGAAEKKQYIPGAAAVG